MFLPIIQTPPPLIKFQDPPLISIFPLIRKIVGQNVHHWRAHEKFWKISCSFSMIWMYPYKHGFNLPLSWLLNKYIKGIGYHVFSLVFRQMIRFSPSCWFVTMPLFRRLILEWCSCHTFYRLLLKIWHLSHPCYAWRVRASLKDVLGSRICWLL